MLPGNETWPSDSLLAPAVPTQPSPTNPAGEAGLTPSGPAVPSPSGSPSPSDPNAGRRPAPASPPYLNQQAQEERDRVQSPDEIYKALDRVPSDYLLEADGDVSIAAAAAGIEKADFLRVLGADRALPQVAKSIHFLALMSSLELLTLAKEEIVARFTDDPTDPDLDDILLSRRPAQSLELKSLLSLFKVSADFIALSNMHQNPAVKGTNRHVPPRPLKGQIIEAGRGLRAPTTDPDNSYPSSNPYPSGNPNFPQTYHDPNPDIYPSPEEIASARTDPTLTDLPGSTLIDPDNPPGYTDEPDPNFFEADLRARLEASPPEVRAIFARALGLAPDPTDEDPLDDQTEEEDED